MLPVKFSAGSQAAGATPTRDRQDNRAARDRAVAVTRIGDCYVTLEQLRSDTFGLDGKATVTVKELTPSARATQKSVKLVFAPTNDKEKWTWEQFEENRKLYPVERLFPYVNSQLEKLDKEVSAALAAHLAAMTKEGDAAAALLETAKAVIKSDPPPLGPVTQARNALAEARKGTEIEAI